MILRSSLEDGPTGMVKTVSRHDSEETANG